MEQTTHFTKSNFAAIAGALLSRASGVVRTMIVNATFGASHSLDAFNAAFRFPNSLRDLFADGALSAAFMTVLVTAKGQGIEEERKLIAIIVGFFSVVTLLIAMLAAYYAQPFMTLIISQHASLLMATTLFQMLAFYLPCTMLNAVAMAILGVHGYTFRAMNGSLFLSVGMIVGALVLAPLAQSFGYRAIMGLGIGAMLGVLMQLLYQLRPLLPLKLLIMPNFNPMVWWQYKPLREVLLLMAPRALGQGAMVIALTINTFFASQIGVGVLTYIATAIIIIQVPIGLFGVATGFAALPVLTSAINTRDSTKFSALLVESLRTAQWLAALTAVGFAILIVPFYVVLFQHGKITFNDTLGNCTAVCAYSMGIIFAAGAKVLVNGLYAINATRQIVYNSLAYLIVNACLSAWLAPRLGILGLGISFGAATAVDCWLNYIFLKRAYIAKGHGSDPYIAGGQSFTTKTILFTVFSFVIGLIGVMLINQLWSHFGALFGINLTFFNALIILLVGGIILLSGFGAIVYYCGPLHLKNIFKRRKVN